MNETTEQRHVVNKTYDEIHVGDFASLTRTLMPEDVKLFAVLTGDFNPTAADARYSRKRHVPRGHGAWHVERFADFHRARHPVSRPGTILIDECLHFARPVTIGDTITVTLTAKQKFDHNKHVILDCVATNQENLQVLRGTAEVLAPSEKISHMQEVHRPRSASTTSTSASSRCCRWCQRPGADSDRGRPPVRQGVAQGAGDRLP